MTLSSVNLMSLFIKPEIAFYPVVDVKNLIPDSLVKNCIFFMNIKTSQASVKAMKELIEKNKEAHRELKKSYHIKLFFLNRIHQSLDLKISQKTLKH